MMMTNNNNNTTTAETSSPTTDGNDSSTTIVCVHPPHIYISTYSTIEKDVSKLDELELKHILSFDTKSSFNHLLTKVYGYNVTTIPVAKIDNDDDHTLSEVENLKAVFPQFVRFISRCILRQENVLICSDTGTSRSVIAVMAYLVAREHISVQEALETIKRSYPNASPDPRFITQLEQQQQSSTATSSSHHASVNTTRSSNASPSSPASPLDNKSSVQLARKLREGMMLREENTNDMTFDRVCCRKCRHELFTAKDVIPHAQEGRGKKDFSFKKMKKDSKSHMADIKKACNSYFIEKKGWMTSMDTDSGDIQCPKCDHRIGAFKWSGLQCSCGVWVRPAVQILKSRVDAE